MKRRSDELQRDVFTELWLLEKYLANMEAKLGDLQEEVYKDLEDKAAGIDVDLNALKGSHDFFLEDFRQKLRCSYVVILVSSLETILESMCDDFGDRNDVRVRFNDLRGDLINRTKKYLRKVRKYDRDLPSTFWESIQDIIKVRNCIVHQAGNVSRSGKEANLRSLQGQCEGYSVEGDQIVLENGFCEWALEAVRDFQKHFRTLL